MTEQQRTCRHRYRVIKAYRDERHQEDFVIASCEHCEHVVEGRFVMPMGATWGVINAVH